MPRQPVSLSSRSVPAFLLLLSLIIYGLLAVEQGFYWDDWAKLLVARLYGLQAYFAYYSSDRPLSAWTHILLTPLLGYSPLAWQILGVLLRWLSAWGMWWALNGLWPQARLQNLAAALLFLVHPAFLQQPTMVTFHQQWVQYVLFFLSLGAMFYAVRARMEDANLARFRVLTGLGLLALFLQVSITEYFFGLELIRPFCLWFLLAPFYLRVARRLLAITAHWMPYLSILIVFWVWRVYFMPLSSEDPHQIRTVFSFIQQPLETLMNLVNTIFVDMVHILINSWGRLLVLPIMNETPFVLLSYAIGAACSALIVLYFSVLQIPAVEPASEKHGWRQPMLVIGFIAALLGPVPAWITGLQVLDDFHSDRFALPAMFGASLLLLVVIDWLAQKRMQKTVLVAVLVALAISSQLQAQNEYRWDYTSQNHFYWQLSWRAPGLEAPTALFFETEPFSNQGLFSTSSAVNLLYPQPEGQKGLAYWVYTLTPRYQHAPDSFQVDLRTNFRTLLFEGTMPNSLLLYNDPRHGSCLWVLSQRDRKHPHLSALIKDFLPISNLDRIQSIDASAEYPPNDLFGPEPEHTWCYYFEKADLARQLQDWDLAASLADEALARGYSMSKSGSNSPYEWMPMIEAYARIGRMQEAAELTLAAVQLDGGYHAMVCELWADPASPWRAHPQKGKVLSALNCAGKNP
jgi:hypothetical protein